MNKNILTASTLILGLAACGDDFSPDQTVAVTPDFDSAVVIESQKLQSGAPLTAVVTDNNGLAGATISYEWMAGSTVIGTDSDTYVLTDSEVGQTITVSVSFTDDDGYESAATSSATAAIAVEPVAAVGTIEITGEAILEQVLTAVITDDNGLTDVEISYQWLADDVAIVDATLSTLILTEAEVGSVITVSATYTDEDYFSESVLSQATSVVTDGVIVESGTIVNNSTELVEALAAAVEDEVIKLAPGDYSNPGELIIAASGVTVTRTLAALAVVDGTAEQMAAITGSVCLMAQTEMVDDQGTEDAADDVITAVAADNVVLDGLYFSTLAIATGSDCETASSDDYFVQLTTDGNTITNTTFDSEVDAGDKTAWLHIGGLNNTVTRNTFMNHRADNDGAFLKIDSATDATVPTIHTIEYNLFTGYEAAGNSSAYGVMLGNTTGTDSVNTANNIFRYNLFDALKVKTRVIKVQSSGNDIYGNTFANGYGMLSLENGQNNTVRSNVFFGANAHKYEAGVNANSYGNSITHNYFAGQGVSNDSERATLVLTSNEDGDSGNATITTSETTFSNNTIVNNNMPIMIGAKGCDVDPLNTGTFSNNFALNNYTAAAVTELTGSQGPKPVNSSHGTIADDCADSATTFTGDHFYSTLIVGGSNGTRNISAAITAEAPATAPTIDSNGYVVSADAGIGADTTLLYRITALDVGANSTWVSAIAH